MAIMTNIDITHNPTKPELYNRIFAGESGIFDRFFDGENEYSEGSQIMRDPKNIRKYLEFLRNIAFNMFERHEFFVTKGEYQMPKLEFQRRQISILEFPIKHFFEGTKNKIEFIHKSIYEYFVSEYIFKTLWSKIVMRKGVKEIAGMLGELLRNNILSPEILEFLKYKINYSELRSFFRQSNETFQLMLQNGMTYYTNKCYKNILDCEMNVFANMLEILHLWEDEELEIGGEIAKYLKYNIHSGLNLSYLYMSKLDLKGAYLYKANLRGAKLVETDLRNANLVEADLENASLYGAYLENANLVRINLKNTGIFGTILNED